MEEYRQVRRRFAEGGEETVSVLPLGAHSYRLGSTALFLADEKEERVYYSDVIEAEAQENEVLRFCRVVERSRWHHWEWLLPPEVLESSAFEIFKRAIVANGGEWEQVWGGICFAHLPEGSAFDPEAEIEKVLVQVSMALDRAESTRAMPVYKRWRKQLSSGSPALLLIRRGMMSGSLVRGQNVADGTFFQRYLFLKDRAFKGAS